MATPKCRYFGKCGGCTLQHMDYSMQMEHKKKAAQDATKNFDVELISGKEYNYRNKIDLLFQVGKVGFRQRDNVGGIADIEYCAICDDRVNALIVEIRKNFKNADHYDSNKKTGAFIGATIRASSSGNAIIFNINDFSQKLGEAIEKIKEFSTKTSADNVAVAYISPRTEMIEESFITKGKDTLKESLLGKEFQYSIYGFFQNNTEIAQKMHEHVNKILSRYDTKNAELLDLYAGVGTFGINNAELFKKVTIIEEFKQAIELAKQNITNNGIKNATAISMNAKQLAKISFGSPLFVITDPPRSGMDPKTIEQLKKLRPKVIIYISCNIEQLEKDLPKFKDYEIKSTSIFDMFPQTNHIEAVVKLELKNH